MHPKKMVLHFVACHPYITLIVPPLCSPKETSHLTLDTRKSISESVSFLEFLPIIRQILKSCIIKASKYKVQDTTEVVKEEDRL